MTDKKQESNALARLDLRKPEDIVREERARLEALAHQQPPDWWKSYSDIFYGRLRAPSRFPTIVLGSQTVLSAFSVAVLWSASPWWLTLLLVLVANMIASAVVGSIYDSSATYLRQFFSPIGFLISLREWRAVKKLRHCYFGNQDEIYEAKKLLVEFSPARVIREHYVSSVKKLREDVLGDESKMEKAKTGLTDQLGEARKILAELERRRLTATSSPERMQLLKQGITRAKERVTKLESLLERQNLAIKKATEFLDRCQALAEGMDGAIGDLELLRKLDAGIEEDHSVIHQAEEAVDEMVKELYLRMVGLQTAASAVYLPATSSDEFAATALPIESEFAEYERLAERVLALDLDSLASEKPAAP